MLNAITTEQALQDFLVFWQTHFPEQRTMSREAVLAQINDRERDYANTQATDQETVAYQDDVSHVYGAYEKVEFQLVTIWRIATLAKRLPSEAHIVSLGCGPASYELWLATQTNHRFTLVDLSSRMLNRANAIATALGIADRIMMIQSDASSVPDFELRNVSQH